MWVWWNGSNISTGSVRNQGSFITSTNTPLVVANNTLTSNIEVGNYIIGDNIPLDARVISIQDNQFVVMDKNATTTAVNTVKFINHRGFVRRVRVNANGGSTTIVAASGFSFRSSGTHTVGGVPKNAPNDNDPVSPIKTIAGGALNHKNPNPAPIKAPARTANSPTPDT